MIFFGDLCDLFKMYAVSVCYMLANDSDWHVSCMLSRAGRIRLDTVDWLRSVWAKAQRTPAPYVCTERTGGGGRRCPPRFGSGQLVELRRYGHWLLSD